MAIAQLEYPRFKAFNTSSKSLSGGKVFVYEAGTSTKATIWQDADKNSQHSNPVTLDTNGEAEIWFEGPVKVVLEDADGNQQWTMDDIESDIPPTDVGRFNQVENGSFEIDSDADNLPDEWTITEYDTTSTVELDSAEVAHGANSLKFVSQGAGGGTATTTDFFPVNAGQIVTVAFTIKSSVADVQNSVSVRWHDKDQTFISSSTVYNENTSNPTSFEEKRFTASAPATATYAKLRLVGCDSADPTSGTTYYDNVKVYTDQQAAVYGTSGTVEFQDSWTFSGTGGDVTASAADLNELSGASSTNEVFLKSKFIGEVFSIQDDITGVNAPDNTTEVKFIKLSSGLTGSGQYNEGLLTSESVSGSSPKVTATAVISHAASPMDGQTIRLINTEERFLRAGNAGSTQDDAFQGHFHNPNLQRGPAGNSGDGNHFMGTDGANANIRFSDWAGSGGSAVTSNGTHGTPRQDDETRPRNLGIAYYMRIA